MNDLSKPYKKEEDCPKNDRFLFADAYLSDQAIDICKKDIEKRFDNKEKDSLYHEFMNWKRQENEIAIFTLYAYADINVPKKFDCIFNLENSHEFMNESFTVTKCIYEGWLPSKTIDVGHKHLIILEFENKVHEILFRLHQQNTLKDAPKNPFKLGICTSDNFPEIHSHFLEINALKKTYGQNWWSKKENDF